MTERHDHHELGPGLPGQELHAQGAAAAAAAAVAPADDAELLEDHDVPGERARLVGEEVRDEAELLVDVGRVAARPDVPLRVVQLQVPPEKLAERLLIH